MPEEFKPPTVASHFGMRCPKCQDDDHLEFEATIMVRLVPLGFDYDTADPEYDPSSRCECKNCDYEGVVEDFMIGKGAR